MQAGVSVWLFFVLSACGASTAANRTVSASPVAAERVGTLDLQGDRASNDVSATALSADAQKLAIALSARHGEDVPSPEALAALVADAPSALRELVLHAPVAYLGARAAERLGAFRQPQDVAFLAGILVDRARPAPIRAGAAAGLGAFRLEGERAVAIGQILLQALRDDALSVSWASARALAALPSPPSELAALQHDESLPKVVRDALATP